MKLIDIKKGIEYETYEDQVLWVDETSVGIWNYMRLTFRSDSEHITCGLPNDSIFSFWTPAEGMSLEFIKLYPYKEVELRGELFDGKYWFNVYILAKSDDAYEYIDNLYIGDEVIKIGIPVIDEDESLRINLANKGFEVSPMIQSALYNTESEETTPNYVILNNKFKELLLNYMDILGNKGSYKSLINSLKWFEYGDLVWIEQVWNGPRGKFSRRISQELSDEFHNIKVSKTTGLVLKAVDTGKWNEDEMKIKMYLLGKFFEAYFVPIHLELVRSSLEKSFDTNVVWSVGSAVEMDDWGGCSEPLELTIYSNNKKSTYKYNDIVVRPSFDVVDGKVVANVRIVSDVDFDLIYGDKKIKTKGVYDVELKDTGITKMKAVYGSQSKDITIIPKDDLSFDIKAYEVVRDIKGSKPVITNEVVADKEVVWTYGIYKKPYNSLPDKPIVTPLYDIKDKRMYDWDLGNYCTDMNPISHENEAYSRKVRGTYIFEAYNKLIPVKNKSRIGVGLIIRVEANGKPVNVEANDKINMKFSETPLYNSIIYKLEYVFNGKKIEISYPHRRV